MPIVINDFEILDQPPDENHGGSSQAPAQPPAQARLRPEDVERIVRFFIERRERVAAD